jgi:hypothetical protein
MIGFLKKMNDSYRKQAVAYSVLKTSELARLDLCAGIRRRSKFFKTARGGTYVRQRTDWPGFKHDARGACPSLS